MAFSGKRLADKVFVKMGVAPRPFKTLAGPVATGPKPRDGRAERRCARRPKAPRADLLKGRFAPTG
jgi:hypothetical protein